MKHDWKPERLRIADVREREDLQLRAGGLSASYVRDLAQAFRSGVELPPIKVARIGRTLCLVDGFHRLAAVRSNGDDAVEALVAPMELEGAKAVARVANVGHGRRLTAKDKARIFDDYVTSGCHLGPFGTQKSSRVISQELGGAYSHVSVLKALRARGVEPDYDVEEAEGSKWGGGFPGRGGRADEDELGLEGDGPLDAEYGAEVQRHLGAVEALFFGLGDSRREQMREAVRGMLGRLEANEAPFVTGRLDI